MASSNTTPTPAPSLPLEQPFLPRQEQRFADNEFQNISEKSFRDAFGDVDKSFVKLADLNTNLVRGATFQTDFVVLVNGLPTINTAVIPPRYVILGMEAVALYGVDAATANTGVRADPIYFKLLPYAAGDVAALVNAKPSTTARLRARWVRISGSEEDKVASYLDLPLEDTRLFKGEVYKYTFSDLPGQPTRLFAVRGDLNQPQNPLPTGLDSDPYYQPFAPLAAASAAAANWATIEGPDPRANASLDAELSRLASLAYVEATNATQQAAIDAHETRIDDLEADIVSVENEVANLSTDNIAEATNKYFTGARAVAAQLSGYVKAGASRAIAATDSIRTALGLLEYKVDATLASQPTAATPAEITTAGNNTKYTTPAGLYAGGIRAGSEFFVGQWNPNRNRIAPNNYAIVTTENLKGSVYLIAETAVPFTTSVSISGANATAISVYNSSRGIGYGHTVTGPGIPAGTTVTNAPNGSTVVLSQPVTLAAGDVLTFAPKIGSLTTFLAGDWLVNLGGGVWATRPGAAAAAPGTGVSPLPAQSAATAGKVLKSDGQAASWQTDEAGTSSSTRTALLPGDVLKLDADGVYPTIVTGTFTLDVSGAVKGKVATITVAVNGTAPDLSNPALILVGKGHKAGKTNDYAFLADGDGKIKYKITSY